MGYRMSENIIYALHGFLGQATDWNVIKKNVSTEFIADDLFATDSPEVTEFEDYIEELSEYIDEEIMDRKKKIFVGYSLGGRLGLHLLKENHEQFDHYVFLSTNPGLSEDEQSERNKRLIADMKWASLISESNWKSFIADWNKQSVFENSASEPERHYVDYDIDKLKRALVVWSVSQQEDFRDVIQDFQHKITWVVGEKDSKYFHMAEDMKQKKILLDYKKISSGHRLLLDQPTEISKLLSDLF